jgi:hypothetical protein
MASIDSSLLSGINSRLYLYAKLVTHTTTPSVAIIGAGPAGIAASVAVARHGGHAYLIERSEHLGGSATNARVGTVCGLSQCGTHLSEIPQFDNPGFAGEFSRRVAQGSNTHLIRNSSGLTYLPYIPEIFERVAQEHLTALDRSATTLLGCTDIKLSYNSHNEPFSIRMSDSQILVDAVVDCSGAAVVSQQLGLGLQRPAPYQAAALVFDLENLPVLDEMELAFLVRKTLREGVLKGSIPERLSYVSLVPGSLRGAAASFKLGTQAPEPGEPSRSAELIERQARMDLVDLVRYLTSTDERLHKISLRCVASALGVRSDYRGVGLAVLSDHDVTESRRQASGVALGFWPAERWDTPIRPELTFSQYGTSYDIPLGALCSKELPGVYFAGRCISASDQAIASARVMGTCLSTGFAAGWTAVGKLLGQDTETVIATLRAQQVDPFYQ